MLPGSPSQGECLTTHTAGVWSFPRVDKEMLCEVTFLPEGPPTVVACVRLPTIQVHLSVPRQGKWIPKLLATNGTLVRFFSRVKPLVLDKILFLPEALAA